MSSMYSFGKRNTRWFFYHSFAIYQTKQHSVCNCVVRINSKVVFGQTEWFFCVTLLHLIKERKLCSNNVQLILSRLIAEFQFDTRKYVVLPKVFKIICCSFFISWIIEYLVNMKNLHTRKTWNTIDLRCAKLCKIYMKTFFPDANTFKSNEINGLFHIKYGKNLKSKVFTTKYLLCFLVGSVFRWLGVCDHLSSRWLRNENNDYILLKRNLVV